MKRITGPPLCIEPIRRGNYSAVEEPVREVEPLVPIQKRKQSTDVR